MTQLTKMMAMFLAKASAGETTGGNDKYSRRGREGRGKNINPLATLCKIFGKMVMHNKAKCRELEANAATLPPGWPFKNRIDRGQ